MTDVVVAHPGEMGVSLARAASTSARVAWIAADRSDATRRRAEAAGLEQVADLGEALRRCALFYSVCPPDAAESLARSVAAIGYDGVYVDCNAIAPATATAIEQIVNGAGARFVDGGIIGPPATRSGTTRLYLSGAHSAEAAAPFAGSALATVTLDADTGAASALKMAYAAWTKGSSALLLDVCALADATGVGDALREEWALSQSGLAERAEAAAAGNAFKGWRFEGEMREIAATFAAVNLPDGFHTGAAALYARLAGFRGREADVSLAEVIAAVRAHRPDNASDSGEQ